MQMTQADYNDRKRRVDNGEGDDEDARLVKQYEAEGYTVEGKADNQPTPAPETTPSAVPIRADDSTRNEQDEPADVDGKTASRKSTGTKGTSASR